MQGARYILLTLAALCFLFATFGVTPPRVNFVALGLFLLTIAELAPRLS
jgi:hypothetical protein